MEITRADIDANRINSELLPESLQELGGLIGLGSALDLADAYAGIRLYVPGKATADHTIARVIGFDNLKVLCAHFGETPMRLPKIDKAIKQIKRHLVLEMKEDGKSNSCIALTLNYTERHVERIVSELRNENQIDLFNE